MDRRPRYRVTEIVDAAVQDTGEAVIVVFKNTKDQELEVLFDADLLTPLIHGLTSLRDKAKAKSTPQSETRQ